MKGARVPHTLGVLGPPICTQTSGKSPLISQTQHIYCTAQCSHEEECSKLFFTSSSTLNPSFSGPWCIGVGGPWPTFYSLWQKELIIEPISVDIGNIVAQIERGNGSRVNINIIKRISYFLLYRKELIIYFIRVRKRETCQKYTKASKPPCFNFFQ